MIITTSEHPTNPDSADESSNIYESSNAYEKPTGQKQFNWRKHISKNEKLECDQLINEIIKLPENILAFQEMLKQFQIYSGQTIDIAKSSQIFPKFFEQSQE